MTHRLAVRLDSLGDLLVTGPALRALRATCDRLTLLCGPRGRAGADLLPGVDEVVCWEAPWIDPEPGAVRREDVEAVCARIGALDVDEALVFTSFHQSPLPTALLLRLAGVPWVGAVSRDYPGSLLDLRVRPVGRIPEPEAQRRLALAAGGELPTGDEGTLAVRVDESGLPPDLPAPPYVVLHPGASVPARTWPAERFREACARLVDDGQRVVVTGSPDELELTASVAGAGEGAVDLGGATDLNGLAAVLREADAVVVGNTGPAHLAAAVGTPVVSLFAPTVPAEVWAPYGVPVALLGDQHAACRDTRATRCPVPGHPCLASVDARTVVRAVRQVASGTGLAGAVGARGARVRAAAGPGRGGDR